MGRGDSPLLGTWKLLSFTQEDASTGEKFSPLGSRPVGYISYSPDGRMMVILVGDNRMAPKDVVPTDQEMIRFYKSMLAYAGTYTIDGNRVVHHIDASWNQAWTGTQQIRFFKLDGGTLTLTGAAGRRGFDGRIGTSTVVWERVES
jgi:hypothetical protein